MCECRWNITHFWMYSICTYLYTYMYMHDNKGCTTCFPPKMLNNTQPNIYHTFRLLIWCKSNIFLGPEEKKCFQNLVSSLARVVDPLYSSNGVDHNPWLARMKSRGKISESHTLLLTCITWMSVHHTFHIQLEYSFVQLSPKWAES